MSDERKTGLRDQMFTFGNLGVEMLVAVLIGTFGGYLLDRWLHTKPWLLIAGIVLGAAAGFRNIFRLFGQSGNRDRNR